MGKEKTDFIVGRTVKYLNNQEQISKVSRECVRTTREINRENLEEYVDEHFEVFIQPEFNMLLGEIEEVRNKIRIRTRDGWVYLD